MCLLLAAAPCIGGQENVSAVALPSTSSQALVVSAADSLSTTGRLAIFERDGKSGAWRQVGGAVPVSLGRNGLAAANRISSGLPLKVEGDGKTPIGTFSLESIFGRESSFPTGLPYLAIARETEAIDDPASRYYNRLVDRRNIRKADWKSSEQMFRKDSLYDLGVVVGYNSAPVLPGRGSCIFLHIWRSPGAPTAGCVAMARPDLERIVRWLKSAARPVIAINIAPNQGGGPSVFLR